MTQALKTKRPNIALLYRLVVGGLCTGLLAVGFLEPSVFGWSYGPNWLAFSLYILLATLARLFSFEAPERRITLTLDTPIYLASVVSLGEVMGGLACYASLFLYLTTQTFYRRLILGNNDEPVLENIARLLFAPGMGTAVLLALVALLDHTPNAESHAGLYRFVLLLGVVAEPVFATAASATCGDLKVYCSQLFEACSAGLSRALRSTAARDADAMSSQASQASGGRCAARRPRGKPVVLRSLMMLRIAAAGVATLRAGYDLHVLVRFSLEPRIAPATHLCKERVPQDQ
mgnify:CR=1 FL=1